MSAAKVIDLPASAVTRIETPLTSVIQKIDAANVDARATFAALIRERVDSAARAAAQNTLDLAVIVADAKKVLGTTEWLAMVEQDLGWKRSTAYAFQRIAENPVLSASNMLDKLPASWGTLEILARLEHTQLEAAIERGDVRPDMKRSDVAKLLRPERAESDQAGDREPDEAGQENDLLERSRRLAKELREVRRLWKERVPRDQNRGLDSELCRAIVHVNRALEKMAREGAR